jgi:hypothetical protein
MVKNASTYAVISCQTVSPPPKYVLPGVLCEGGSLCQVRENKSETDQRLKFVVKLNVLVC